MQTTKSTLSTDAKNRFAGEHVFLDVNCLYDLLFKRDLSYSHLFDQSTLYVSAVSIHIALYVARQKMPQAWIEGFLSYITIIPFDETIATTSLYGPTADFEDNIQLLSALEADVSFFCTRDVDLLQRKKYRSIELISPV